MLTEDQIRRYGRQILLREVGGKGQERLLNHGVLVLGDNEALSVAVTYLALGGSPLVLPPDFVTRDFLAGTRLAELNPDADRIAPRRCLLVAAGHRWSRQGEEGTGAGYGSLQQGDHPVQPEPVEGLSTPLEVSGVGHQLLETCTENVVVVGGDGVAFGGVGACTACLEAAAATLAAAVPGGHAVLLGGLAALTVQRMVLGFSSAQMGLVRLRAGCIRVEDPPRCDTHR